MFLLLLSLAAADPALPGDTVPASTGHAGTFLLPDARLRLAGSVEVAAGAGAFAMQVVEYCLASSNSSGCGGSSMDAMAMPALRAAWSPGADLRLESNLGIVLNGGVAGSVSLSWSTQASRVVRTGAFVGGLGTASWDLSGLEGAVAAGGLLSAQWSRVAFDLSVPLIASTTEQPVSFLFPAVFSEAGLSFALGHGHALRVGMASLFPGIGWQYDQGRFMARIDIHSVGLMSVGRAEVGARF